MPSTDVKVVAVEVVDTPEAQGAAGVGERVDASLTVHFPSGGGLRRQSRLGVDVAAQVPQALQVHSPVAHEPQTLIRVVHIGLLLRDLGMLARYCPIRLAH